ncbi:hypothetical protein VE01_07757 [Pseudogymnoascus verrucosus]|uniref:Tautomerase n=1 Tax=Pseudogymnoascus verrucosus TaxID=342668 RepID=A0A1B8GF03_9PEZI|nr:uncharacterized protein VE01_07757 [Pseudogymnoascus verrucosus]OBT94408.1 hypothetical protein VE01_07757 [Pseudogymnoascus verrucosus]
MPLVKIDVIKGRRSPAQLRTLADTVQTVMLQKVKAPPRDRYQIITQHEKDVIICDDTNLGFERTDDLVVVQVFQQGRTTEDKQNMFAALADHLSTECGLEKTDLVISCVENKSEDWSFGLGEAQILNGKL